MKQGKRKKTRLPPAYKPADSRFDSVFRLPKLPVASLALLAPVADKSGVSIAFDSLGAFLVPRNDGTIPREMINSLSTQVKRFDIEWELENPPKSGPRSLILEEPTKKPAPTVSTPPESDQDRLYALIENQLWKQKNKERHRENLENEKERKKSNLDMPPPPELLEELEGPPPAIPEGTVISWKKATEPVSRRDRYLRDLTDRIQYHRNALMNSMFESEVEEAESHEVLASLIREKVRFLALEEGPMSSTKEDEES